MLRGNGVEEITVYLYGKEPLVFSNVWEYYEDKEKIHIRQIGAKVIETVIFKQSIIRINIIH